jgi:nucleoside 2-deoxyribosyltransferase
MRAFIAMPFSENFKPHWEAIQEVCQALDITTFRVDQNLSYERHIDLAIRKEIEESDFMIAILTGDKTKTVPNANVAFEVGYAQGIGKEVVLLADSIECLPFDFKQQRTSLYHDDVAQMKLCLEKELKLILEMLHKKQKEQLQAFFKEISRCLDIVVSPEFRFFKEALGYQNDQLWCGFYYFKDKYFLLYTVCVGEDLRKLDIHAWLSNTTYQTEQKAFAKKYYEAMRRSVGYDVAFNFEVTAASNALTRTLDKNFLSQTLSFPQFIFSLRQQVYTNEALTVALRLKAFIETLQPVFVDFVKQKNLPDIL